MWEGSPNCQTVGSGSDTITQEHYGDRGLFQSPSFARTEDTTIEGWGLGNLTLQQQNSSKHVVVMSPVPGPELRPMPQAGLWGWAGGWGG